LLDLLETFIFDSSGEVVDLRTDGNRRFKAMNDYASIVVQFYQLRMEIYCETVLKDALGINHYWFRYEFAKSRGQIHGHLLGIRGDRQPHCLLHACSNAAKEQVATESLNPEAATQQVASQLAQWCVDALSLTATHPATDEDGMLPLSQIRPPEGTLEPTSASGPSPLHHYMGIAGSLKEDHVSLSNQVAHHSCNDYCLGPQRFKDNVPVPCCCRMGARSEARAGKGDNAVIEEVCNCVCAYCCVGVVTIVVTMVDTVTTRDASPI
jgi:hypothetical protein